MTGSQIQKVARYGKKVGLTGSVGSMWKRVRLAGGLDKLQSIPIASQRILLGISKKG